MYLPLIQLVCRWLTTKDNCKDFNKRGGRLLSKLAGRWYSFNLILIKLFWHPQQYQCMCASDEIVERFNEYSISCSMSIIPMTSVSYGMQYSLRYRYHTAWLLWYLCCMIRYHYRLGLLLSYTCCMIQILLGSYSCSIYETNIDDFIATILMLFYTSVWYLYHTAWLLWYLCCMIQISVYHTCVP